MRKILLMMMALLVSGSAMADVFYLQGFLDGREGTNTADKTLWFDATTGGTAMTVADNFAGNDFNIQANQIWNAGTVNFDGTLVVDVESASSSTPIVLGSANWEVDGLNVSAFSKISHSTPTVLQVVSMNLTDNVVFRNIGGADNHMALSVTTLTGDGTITFGQQSSDVAFGFDLSIADGTGFSGTIEASYGPLDLSSVLDLSSATLDVGIDIAQAAGVVISNDATFDQLNHGGISVAAGIYTAAELNIATFSSSYSGPGSITVLTDNILPPVTFYLQAKKPNSAEETDKTNWFDATTAGSVMTADFAGNRFELNGKEYESKESASVNFFKTFGGTLVMDDASFIEAWTNLWAIAGLEVGSDSTTSNNGIRLRRSNTTLNVTNFSLNGLLRIRANSAERGMTLNVTNLTGDGTLSYGRDTDEEDSNWPLDIDNSDFAGTIELGYGNLDINDTLSLPDASLTVLDSSSVEDVVNGNGNSLVLTNDLTIGAMTYGSTALPVGTYTAAQLESFFVATETGTVGRFSGTGSLTIPLAPVETFYLQAEKSQTVVDNDKTSWWDDQTAGSQMSGSDAFAGNLFELNGFTFKSRSTAASSFDGTLLKDDEAVYIYATMFSLAGLDVSANAVTSNNGLILRKSNMDLAIASLNLEGYLLVRPNTSERNMDLSIPLLTGSGTLSYGRDNDEEDSNWLLDIDNSAFAGTIEVRYGNLNINDTLPSGRQPNCVGLLLSR